MFSNCGTGAVPKIARRNILIGRDNIPNNISNNLEPVNMDQPSYTDAGSKSSDLSDPNTSSGPSKDTTAMSSNLHQNQVDKKSAKNAEDVKYLDRHQVEDKLEQIREYISITTSLICNMRKTDEQNDPTPDDSERLEQMVHELKDSEHKLIRILDNWNQNGQMPLPEVESDLQPSSTSELVDYKEEAACLELQKPLVAEQDQQPTLDFANDNSRNNTSNQVEAIQELEERLVTWNKAQMNRLNLQDHLESQVEMLGDTISHLQNDSDTRRDIMDILDQKDSSLQAEHVSLQNKLLELQTKKQQVDHLVEQLHVLNGHKAEDQDVGTQVRRIVCMKDQLSKLKDMLHSIQNIEDVDKSASEVLLENIPPESIEATLRIRNDVRNSTGTHLPGPLQEEANVHRHTQKQVNKKSTNSIDRQRSLQAELQAKKHELEELMSKRKATSNLNHDGNSEKSSLGMYNSIYNAYNHKEQYSSDEVSDDEANDFNTDLNLSIESLNKNQMPHLNQQHLIPERLSSVNSQQQQQQASTSQQDCWPMENRQQQMLLEEVERGQSEARKGIFVIDPSSYSRQQESYRTQRIQMQKQLELIRNVCDTMLMESAVQPLETDAETFNNQPPPQHLHQRKNHTPSPLYSEPLSYNNTCGTPENQNQINIIQDQNNPLGVMSPMITNMSAGGSSKMSGSRSRGNSMMVGAAGDNAEGMQSAQGSNGYNRCVKPTSSANPDQSANVWQQQQQWLVSNTLQSQAFIMNTLNQCCQMMWLQQREIQSLRNAVQNMQLQQQNQSNAPVSNNQQRFNQYSNLQQGGVSSTPYINTSSSNSAFAYPIAGPSTSSLQLPAGTTRFPSNSDPNCSGVQKSNPNLLGMLPNVNHSFPTSFPMGDTLDVNHTDFRSSNSAQQHVHRSNMTPMSDCLNNCSNNNLSNVNMNNVMHGGNNLASNSNPQIWHERSLNNQVNQGNSRANNYWDNFRR